MIQLVVGWVKDFLNFSKVKEFKQVEKVTPSRLGYAFEHDELKRLMNRLKNFETVQFTDASGTPLTPESISQRFGKDGGIDCIIHVIAPTERGANNVAGRIRNILKSGDY
ncbi:MAG: hypothetical protein RLZZ338_2457 [Cyanobacteriota bacterium]|jgi:hypothetical protein